MELSKNSVISVSVGTFLALIAAGWTASGKVQGYINQISMNTQAIQEVVRSLELSRIDREIASLKKERRELRRDLRADPDNELLLDQLDEVEDAIDSKQAVRECIIKPDQKVCQ